MEESWPQSRPYRRLLERSKFHRKLINASSPVASWSSTVLEEQAVLAHRPGQLSLDNAFALIEATSRPLSRAPI
jgi:hypothetical protein